MACRDKDGNLISADSTNMLNEHNLERISEEKVSQLSFHFLNIVNIYLQS
jgi:leucyl-tRNA synthetase